MYEKVHHLKLKSYLTLLATCVLVVLALTFVFFINNNRHNPEVDINSNLDSTRSGSHNSRTRTRNNPNSHHADDIAGTTLPPNKNVSSQIDADATLNDNASDILRITCIKDRNNRNEYALAQENLLTLFSINHNYLESAYALLCNPKVDELTKDLIVRSWPESNIGIDYIKKYYMQQEDPVIKALLISAMNGIDSYPFIDEEFKDLLFSDILTGTNPQLLNTLTYFLCNNITQDARVIEVFERMLSDASYGQDIISPIISSIIITNDAYGKGVLSSMLVNLPYTDDRVKAIITMAKSYAEANNLNEKDIFPAITEHYYQAIADAGNNLFSIEMVDVYQSAIEYYFHNNDDDGKAMVINAMKNTTENDVLVYGLRTLKQLKLEDNILRELLYIFKSANVDEGSKMLILDVLSNNPRDYYSNELI